VAGVDLGEDVAGGAVVPLDGAGVVEGDDVGGGRGVGSQKTSMSASRCLASWRVRARVIPACGCGPVVLNPASYSSRVAPGPVWWFVVVFVTAGRLLC